MSDQLSKTYDPRSVEQDALRVWNDEKLFHAEPDPSKPAYSMVIPPPNVTAALHLGHALNNTLQDILIRWHRMLGDNTVWLPGTDHAGIATQHVVEKRVLKEEGKKRTQYKREEFVAKIQAFKDEYEQTITHQLKMMGCSCDWDRQAFTMDGPRARAVREAFFRLFKDGLIYRGKRLVNWDPATQTALADDEVEMEEVDGHFYYLRYPLVESGFGDRVSGVGSNSKPETRNPKPEYVIVATTRPETMLGDTAVAINPKDPRAAQLRGRKVRLPIVDRIIPIIEDDYVVLPDPNSDDAKAKFATGFLKVTPAHDPNDYDIGQRHNLPIINVLAPDGTISDKHGWTDVGGADFLLGMDRYEARKAVVEWFRQNKLLEDVKPYRHSVGHSYRSHVPIEPYLSDQWYCKVTDPRLAGAALNAMAPEQLSPSPGTPGEGRGEGSSAAEDESQSRKGPHPNPLPEYRERGQEGAALRFFPARYAKTFQTWHENIRDWCISRQLWWGHRIPVWRVTFDKQNRFIRMFTSQGLDRSTAHGFVDAQIRGLFVPREEGLIAERVVCDPSILLHTTRNERGAGVKEDESSSLFFCTASPEGDRVFEQLSEELDRKRCGKPVSNNFGEIVEYIAGVERDPDVLDTWFSSALWPMSTLGWPDESAIQNPQSEFNVWNPTHTLCTAREIITLWVSRMVMFNLYFTGSDEATKARSDEGKAKESGSPGSSPSSLRRSVASSLSSSHLPFYDVFIHAMVQDGDGRKMSKSLGNGVDPLDIISSHGADAMRFTLTHMSTQTQDVRMPVERDPTTGKNTSPKFDIGRNFCNKMWNAARFALSNLEQLSSTPAAVRPDPEPTDESKWSMFDRWIVSRLMHTMKEVDEALSSYRFDAYAKACYDFFWRDLCDWYVEAIKPAMKDPNRAPQTSAILAACLDASLRLMHPMIPFITEILFWKLNEVRPNRTLENILELPASDRLIRAAWPRRLNEWTAMSADFLVPKLQEIIIAIRQLRNDHKVDPKKSVTVSIKATSDACRTISGNREVIELLATCTIKAIDANLAPIESAAKSQAAGCEIYVEGLVDEAAEQQRAGKRREELTKNIAAMKARLSNAGYVAKAPAHLVKQTQVGSSRVDLQACKLEYSIVSPK